SLHGLRQRDVTPAAVHEAVTDIDDEVARLNRIVNEVLDFARPLRFELAPADLNAICRESANAAQASTPGSPIQLALDPHLPQVTTDGERLRSALVNMLVNARHAVAARESAPPEPAITLRTETAGSRLAIVIEDRGIGLGPADRVRMFDAYFTTKRGG